MYNAWPAREKKEGERMGEQERGVQWGKFSHGSQAGLRIISL